MTPLVFVKPKQKNIMKPEEGLSVRWSKKENDLLISYPRPCDGSLICSRVLSTVHLHNFLPEEGERPYREFNLLKELEERGYDIKTLKISIKLKEKKEGQMALLFLSNFKKPL